MPPKESKYNKSTTAKNKPTKSKKVGGNADKIQNPFDFNVCLKAAAAAPKPVQSNEN